MTVDTSALIAILFAESGHLALVDRILEADHPRIGAPSVAEAAIVLSARSGKPMAGMIEGVLEELGIAVVPFGDTEWKAARDAYLRYGRGRHPAGLNFGDCLSYATAKVARDTLLFVGQDFSRTDITPA